MDKNLIMGLSRLLNIGFNPKSILDIGAHHGYWSLSSLQVFPNANYMLIEPIKYNELQHLCNKISNFSYKNLLLFDKETEVEWYEMKNTGDSIFKEATHHFKNCEPQKKQTTTLDLLFVDTVFDIIKLDVQGSELPILKGGEKLVKNAEIIIMEMPFAGEYNKGVPNFPEHITYMDNIGFKVFDIISLHRMGGNGLVFQIDLVFVNKTSNLINKFQKIINSQGK